MNFVIQAYLFFLIVTSYYILSSSNQLNSIQIFYQGKAITSLWEIDSEGARKRLGYLEDIIDVLQY